MTINIWNNIAYLLLINKYFEKEFEDANFFGRKIYLENSIQYVFIS